MGRCDELGKLGGITRMEQPITVRFQPTLQDALELQSYHRRIAVRPAWRIGLYIMSGFLLLFGAYGLYRGIGRSTIVFIAGLYYPALRPLERRWQVERAYAKDPDKDSEVEWQISAQTLKVKSANVTAELTWSAITKAFCAPSGFVLYMSDTPFWLPRRGFGAGDAFEQLAQIIRANVSAFNHVA